MSGLSIARVLMIIGIVTFLIGGGVYLLSRLGVNLFRLPGDIRFQIGNVTCMIPLVTTLLLSLVLTIVLNVVFRLLNK
jgi:uncharacterized membrane-anchored protein YitT (DUF2179 family)